MLRHDHKVYCRTNKSWMVVKFRAGRTEWQPIWKLVCRIPTGLNSNTCAITFWRHVIGRLVTNPNTVPINIDRSPESYWKPGVTENQTTTKQWLLNVCAIASVISTHHHLPTVCGIDVLSFNRESHRYSLFVGDSLYFIGFVSSAAEYLRTEWKMRRNTKR